MHAAVLGKNCVLPLIEAVKTNLHFNLLLSAYREVARRLPLPIMLIQVIFDALVCAVVRSGRTGNSGVVLGGMREGLEKVVAPGAHGTLMRPWFICQNRF